MKASFVTLTGSLLLTALAVACGSSDGSEFGNGGNGDPNDPNNGGLNQFTDGDGGTSSGPQNVDQLNACATSSANGALTPVNLVIMFDQSGSMGEKQNVRQVKWDPVVAAFKAFFADGKSAGLSASLQYFPQDQNNDNSQTQCAEASYANPEVALTTLPTTAFSTSLASHNPGGGTPTKPALAGAITYAQQIASQKPTDKTVVVLVTDGEPNNCNSTVQNVSSEASAVAKTIPTYVIGVGNNLTNLNTIAAAGGTQQAIIVDVTSAQGTADSFQAALNKIRGQAGSCSFTLPQPPDGKVLDINAVNVVFTPTGGTAEILPYNKDCTGGTGWHYDNPAAPTKVELCPTTCDQAKSDKGGKISIAFGCATKGGVK